MVIVYHENMNFSFVHGLDNSNVQFTAFDNRAGKAICCPFRVVSKNEIIVFLGAVPLYTEIEIRVIG